MTHQCVGEVGQPPHLELCAVYSVPRLDMSSGQLWLLASTAPCTHDSFAEMNPLVPFSIPSQALNKLKRVRVEVEN